MISQKQQLTQTMKTIQIALTAIMLIFVAQPAIAQNKTAEKSGMRYWTEEATGKKIMAEIISKDPDGRRIRLKLKNGKQMWLESNRLSQNDQDYAKTWTLSMVTVKAKTLSSGVKRSDNMKSTSLEIVSSVTSAVLGEYRHEKENKLKITRREILVTI